MSNDIIRRGPPVFESNGYWYYWDPETWAVQRGPFLDSVEAHKAYAVAQNKRTRPDPEVGQIWQSEDSTRTAMIIETNPGEVTWGESTYSLGTWFALAVDYRLIGGPGAPWAPKG